jgi:hypothetical protein
MRLLLAPLGLVLSIACLAACGSSGKNTSSRQHSASRAASAIPAPWTVDPGKALPMSGYEPPTQLRFLKGDGDRDTSMWEDGHRTPDNDEDARLDHMRNDPSDVREGYRDADDRDSLTVGVPASPAAAKTIAAVVKRYYAVAVTGNGAKACSMMARSFARSVVVDYGKFGAPYLHGAKSCAEIASREFAHSRRMITAAIYITAVHLEHPDRAYALFGSRTAPAGFIAVVREGGMWKVDALLGRVMP